MGGKCEKYQELVKDFVTDAIEVKRKCLILRGEAKKVFSEEQINIIFDYIDISIAHSRTALEYHVGCCKVLEEIKKEDCCDKGEIQDREG